MAACLKRQLWKVKNIVVWKWGYLSNTMFFSEKIWLAHYMYLSSLFDFVQKVNILVTLSSSQKKHRVASRLSQQGWVSDISTSCVSAISTKVVSRLSQQVASWLSQQFVSAQPSRCLIVYKLKQKTVLPTKLIPSFPLHLCRVGGRASIDLFTLKNPTQMA